MLNNSQTTWVCVSCNKMKATHPHGVTFIKTVHTQSDKHKSLGRLGQKEFDIISSPTGWLDCNIIHESQILLANVNKSITGFQRPTLGPVGQFDIQVSDFVQILHVNNNHWICVSSIKCAPGYVNLLDSQSKTEISQEIVGLVKNLLGPSYKGINQQPVQQQQNNSDCGVFTIAFATCLVYGQDPQLINFSIPMMHPHLLNCLQGSAIHPFLTV